MLAAPKFWVPCQATTIGYWHWIQMSDFTHERSSQGIDCVEFWGQNDSPGHPSKLVNPCSHSHARCTKNSSVVKMGIGCMCFLQNPNICMGGCGPRSQTYKSYSGPVWHLFQRWQRTLRAVVLRNRNRPHIWHEEKSYFFPEWEVKEGTWKTWRT